MAILNLAHQRLHNQHIAGTRLGKPEDVVSWLGAVQAQDYTAAKWAVGQRTTGLTDAAIEQACTDGTILRTHILRPTWHFVTPADIRWMLALTAPRIHAANRTYYRQLELDDTIIGQCKDIMVKALQGGNQLTRNELGAILEQAGIDTRESLRLAYITGIAELDGVVCSGARRGKQFTYALLDERAPQTRPMDHDEALAELTRRYFTSHGPATLKDYVWWSGLTTAEAKAGIDLLKDQLVEEVIGDQSYWRAELAPFVNDPSPTAYLLPNYDEYLVAYVDRTAIFDVSSPKQLDSRGNVLFNHTIVIDGQIVGTWKRTFKKDAVVISAEPFAPFSAAENDAFNAAIQRFGEFVGLPVVLAEPSKS
jgi:hypothetical protein